MYTINSFVIGMCFAITGSVSSVDLPPQDTANTPQQRATAELVCRAQLTPALLTRASLTGPQTTEGLTSVAQNANTRLQQLHELDSQIRQLSTEVEQLSARVSTGRALPPHLEQHIQAVKQLNHLRAIRYQMNEQTRAVFSASLSQNQRQTIAQSTTFTPESHLSASHPQSRAVRSSATDHPSSPTPYVCPNVRSAWRAGCGLGNP